MDVFTLISISLLVGAVAMILLAWPLLQQWRQRRAPRARSTRRWCGRPPSGPRVPPRRLAPRRPVLHRRRNRPSRCRHAPQQ
jgi:tight adherence protein C